MNATANIIVVVNVPPTVAAGSITANSSVTATTGDPNAANNSTTIVTPVTVACDLAVTNSGTPSPVAAGGNITYTQVVTNTGPSNCSTATFNEATPANTTFVSVAVVNAGGGTWTCSSAPVVQQRECASGLDGDDYCYLHGEWRRDCGNDHHRHGDGRHPVAGHKREQQYGYRHVADLGGLLRTPRKLMTASTPTRTVRITKRGTGSLACGQNSPR